MCILLTALDHGGLSGLASTGQRIRLLVLIVLVPGSLQSLP